MHNNPPKLNIFILRVEKLCGDFLKRQCCPRRGSGARACEEPRSWARQRVAALPGKCPSQASTGDVARV